METPSNAELINGVNTVFGEVYEQMLEKEQREANDKSTKSDQKPSKE